MSLGVVSGWPRDRDRDVSGDGVDPDGNAALVYSVVVSRAKGNEVVEVGWTAVLPRHEVVRFGVGELHDTAGECAGVVDGGESSSLVAGRQPFRTSNVEGYAVAVENDGDDVGLAGQPPHCFSWYVDAVGKSSHLIETSA